MGHAVVCGNRPLARVGEVTAVDAAAFTAAARPIAALAMWSIWAIAYVLGFASRSVVHAYDGPGSSLATVTDQEITAFVLWLAAACSFVPVIFVSLLTWLRDGADPGEEPASPGVRGWGRQPRRASAGQARR